MDRITPKERLNVPLKYRLYDLYERVMAFLIGKENTVSYLSESAKELIREHVSSRKYYSDLSDQECAELLSCIIRSLPQHLKAGIISDADLNIRLPNLIANYLETPTFDAGCALLKGISDVFHKSSIFSLDIQEAFDEEWIERWPEPNEHFEHDFRQRGRDARGDRC